MSDLAHSPPATVTEFERQLERFVNATLLGGAGVVHRDSRLFEDGYINSLRILDLIAFIEKTLGRRIPDRAVRLANFRSIGVIARAFHPAGSDAPPIGDDATPAADASRAERPLERRTDRSRFSSPIAALIARGDLATPAPGRVALSGLALELLGAVDRTVVGWARALGAPELRYPSLIDLATLERAGQIESFPQQLTTVSTLHAHRSTTTHALAPAVCYHCYPQWAGTVLPATPTVITACGRCYRQENGEYEPLARLWEFTMREIVFLGARADVETLRRRLITQVAELAAELDLEATIEAATDPFFIAPRAGTDDRSALGRRLAQQAGALKHELLLAVSADGQAVAAASFNHHHEFFGERFDVRLPDGGRAHSGCVAFGLERWVLALLAQHGIDERAWPEGMRRWFAAMVRSSVALPGAAPAPVPRGTLA